jgi:N-acetylglucosamine-6-phosphate deacetylase
VASRLFLCGADVVLPDRVAPNLTVVIEDGRIVDLTTEPVDAGPGDTRHDLAGHLLVPGFIDVHVHGLLGVDVMDDETSVRTVARALPRFGVTAFCPTSIACSPEALASFMAAVANARMQPDPSSARVLPAHLESGFINPDYRGAQPLEWLRTYMPGGKTPDVFASPDIGIFTMAPEIPGGFDLLRAARKAGVRVSLGHSGATYEQAIEAIDLGAQHATHLFNRMSPMGHRDPGLVGAVLEREEVAAEIIGDGFHVHPVAMRVAIAAKGRSRVMAITDGTAGSGLPRGACATLGGHRITVGATATLDDGTFAGSVATMDRVFSVLVTRAGQSLVDAATVCSTTPARELGLTTQGAIVPGHLADLVALSSSLQVAHTWIAGQRTWHPEPRTLNPEQNPEPRTRNQEPS